MGYKDKEVDRAYHREWVRKRRASFFHGKCCVKCGSIQRLELDHIDPKTKVTHAIWTWSEERRNNELAKCQVLCHDCHMTKTLAERPKTTHGTIQMYFVHKCRCKLCVDKKRSTYPANNTQKRAKRLKQKEMSPNGMAADR